MIENRIGSFCFFILVIVLGPGTLHAEEYVTKLVLRSNDSRQSDPNTNVVFPSQALASSDCPSVLLDQLAPYGFGRQLPGVVMLICADGSTADGSLSGDSIRVTRGGDATGESLTFVPLLATADRNSFYGLGVFVFWDFETSKGHIVRVEATGTHTVSEANKDGAIVGTAKWSQPIEVRWSSPDEGCAHLRAGTILNDGKTK